jgi:squalene-associated FAD-dependent desaturase
VPRVLIAGGGLAGLAAASALGGAGFQVEVFEARPFLGGRATSYRVPGSIGESAAGASFSEEAQAIDNCQHVLLRCCVNLLNFYDRLGSRRHIRFHREFYFIEPGGRVSVLSRGPLPAPLHFIGSFLRLSFLNYADKLAIARGLLALRRERTRRADLDRITMLDWLLEKRQTRRAIDRFWRQVLVSAVNEDLDRMAARHGFQVFWLGFLAQADSYEMGVPTVPLAQLYSEEAWRKLRNVSLRLRTPVERIGAEGFSVQGRLETADYYICALPFERLEAVALAAPPLAHSPITGVHLWFDREITALPHATLLDRTIQWMFNKNGGRYLQLVVSASRALTDRSRNEIIELALSDLAAFFPKVPQARLLKGHVVKEQRATLSAAPDTEPLRADCHTHVPNLFLAGDWTRTGWPATMEGAVRSGYLAAEAVARAAGCPAQFLIPE